MNNLPVIAAVDGSDDSTRALEWALTEARMRQATLRIVHVTRTVAARSGEATADGAQVEDSAVIEDVRASLADRDGLPPLEYLTVEGTSGAVLPELGAQAQLLVLGSRGRGGFASLILGSNGLATARDADCPVIVVPRPGRQVHTTTTPEPGPRVVVGIPYDAADTEEDPTVGFAHEEAALRSARLHAVCAYPWPVATWAAAGDFVPSAVDQQAAEDECLQLVKERIAPFADRHPHVRVDIEVAPGDAAGHLVAASGGAELLVVGRHRRRALSPARMIGSVTHAALLHAAAPVAVVPAAATEPEAGRPA